MRTPIGRTLLFLLMSVGCGEDDEARGVDGSESVHGDVTVQVNGRTASKDDLTDSSAPTFGGWICTGVLTHVRVQAFAQTGTNYCDHETGAGLSCSSGPDRCLGNTEWVPQSARLPASIAGVAHLACDRDDFGAVTPCYATATLVGDDLVVSKSTDGPLVVVLDAPGKPRVDFEFSDYRCGRPADAAAVDAAAPP